jgi:hypothetical protein
MDEHNSAILMIPAMSPVYVSEDERERDDSLTSPYESTSSAITQTINDGRSYR